MTHPALSTPLTERLGCTYPILQTAMGWVATPKLVAATCNAGGFGFLAGAVIPAEQIEEEILKVKALTDKPFGLNLHMFLPGADHMLDMAIKHGLRAVSYSRSPSAALVSKLKDAGLVCIPTVGAVKHAVAAVKMGADMVTVQGGEGGGHTGSVPTSLLVPQVLDAVKVPVVAAGGFRDGRGLVAALAYGAAGIAMGTRFLMTSDSPVPRATLERYLTSEVTNIIVSTRVDGAPMRMILNETLGRLEQAGPLSRLITALKSGLAFRKHAGLGIVEMLKSALANARANKLTLTETMMAANSPMLIQRSMVEGHPSEGVLPSGQVAGLIRDLPSAAEVIDSIIAQAEARLAALNPGARAVAAAQ
ncbi:nitronate monooxygenase [Oleomonas cavernae]|uniref:Nitronate monooxygenase n=1 Tax=Oleomonas cavernae TaxID=2320859 RepID=A0A418WE28_9PROT|nr:nitronate monooxygenase [Oleomonas cavernae]RJF88271.1 nitronate monooxygenase [Oleomonas cavernae]